MTDFLAAGGKSDLPFMARSKTIIAPLAVGTYNCIRVPKNAFVSEVYLETQTACTAGTALDVSVGFSGNGETADTDFFMTKNDTNVDGVGMARATQAAIHFEGKRFTDASGMITLTLGTGSNLTAGQLKLYIEYFMLNG